MEIKTFEFIERQVLRILNIKKGTKEVGNISYYRTSNSEIDDIMDIKLLEEIQKKYPESTLEVVKIDTEEDKARFEKTMINKLTTKSISIHWVPDMEIPNSTFGGSGKIYASKKTLFKINIATVDEEYLKDLEAYYEVLIPASDENDELFTSFVPVL